MAITWRGWRSGVWANAWGSNDSAVDVRVSHIEFDTQATPCDVKVSWIEFDTQATPCDVRVSHLAFDSRVPQLEESIIVRGGSAYYYKDKKRVRIELDREEDEMEEVMVFIHAFLHTRSTMQLGR